MSVAVTERADEDHLMSSVVKKLAMGVEAPLVIDTTDDTFQDAAKAGLFSRNTTVVQFKNFYAQGLT